MHRKVLFTILSLSFISCSKSLIQDEDSLSEEMIMMMYEAEDRYLDSLCIAEKERAEKDIRENNLTFVELLSGFEDYEEGSRMRKMLLKYKINFDSTFHLCAVRIDMQNCYGNRMELEITKRFGSNFIDSIRTEAKKEMDIIGR
jgi:hypothetical protein